MSRLGLLLIISLLCAFDAKALQLGDDRDQIVTQYGVPVSGELPVDRGIGTYQWSGWRLDIEIMQGTAQRLIFTKDTGLISEAEECQLLNEKGGVAAWQPANHVAVDAMSAKKWRRASDGAEAFTLANDGRAMCLVTGAWAAAWTKAHVPVTRPAATVQGGNTAPNVPGIHRQEGTRVPAASPIPGLMGLAVLVGLVAFACQAIKQKTRKKRRSALTLPSPLWKVTGELR